MRPLRCRGAPIFSGAPVCLGMPARGGFTHDRGRTPPARDGTQCGENVESLCDSQRDWASRAARMAKAALLLSDFESTGEQIENGVEDRCSMGNRLTVPFQRPSLPIFRTGCRAGASVRARVKKWSGPAPRKRETTEPVGECRHLMQSLDGCPRSVGFDRRLQHACVPSGMHGWGRDCVDERLCLGWRVEGVAALAIPLDAAGVSLCGRESSAGRGCARGLVGGTDRAREV